MPLAAGTHLGPYRIIAPIGSGGMGEVYRAHDDRLGRDVAIKVLPTEIAVTPEARARFEREARTISQLSHPHICTLHDRGEHDGIDFLVMEVLDGETLAQRLEKGPLPVVEVLSLGRQIAEALAGAHRAGVVHRDLKPGNVMLTRGGAKLMDFGLARPARPAAAAAAMSQTPTQSQPLTAEGTIVGTFQYMAPEQLEGKEADARTDLWALGCVLYEMATGARAFAGESQASLIAAIMTGAPRPATELRPVTPPGLERLIQRCLLKDPDARIQSALDVAFVLDLIAAGDARGAATAPAATSVARRAAPVLWAAAAVLIAAGAFVAGRLTAPPSGEGSIRVSTLSQGTRDSEPAVSRDGRMVAFATVRQSGQGLWLMDMTTRSELKLTGEDDHFPRFTPDGGTILFTRTQRGRQSLWRVPTIGGAPRLLLEDASDADVSPDGGRIAYFGNTGDSGRVQSRLMLAKTDGTDARELWSRGSVLGAAPRWSPDGRQVVIFKGGTQNAPSSLVVVDVSTGSAREYASPNGHVTSNAVWDGSGHGLIVAEGVGVTAIQRGASGRLFQLDTRSGRYRPLGWLENFPAGIDLLPDGRLVLWSPVARQNLREVAIDARDLNAGRRLTSGLAIDRQPVYSPDGRSVMFSSNRGGTLDLWEVSVETGEMHRVTDDPEDDWDPEYAPDGRNMFWCSGRSGAFEIWTARRDGAAPRPVSRDSLDAENPSVTPDNRSVLYSSSHPAKSGLWRVPAAGGEGDLLLRGTTLIPDLSPDGRHVSIITDVGTIEARLSVFDLLERKLLPGAVPLQVFPGTVQIGRSRFTPDGNSIVFIQLGARGEPMLVKRPLSAWRTGEGTIETLFPAATEGIESFDFSPDGKRATISVVDWISGLTIAEGVRGIVPPKRTR
jgi:Tol biopolymer transport system component/aminoglycoside phosphotransferase (APT) family kinase protein